MEESVGGRALHRVRLVELTRAVPETVDLYLEEKGHQLNPTNRSRRLASIVAAHRAKRFPSPTAYYLVRLVFKGSRRIRGMVQREAKPLLKEYLFALPHATL